MNKLILLIALSLLGFFAMSFTNTTPLQQSNLSVQAQWEIDHAKILTYMETKGIKANWLNSGLYYTIDNEGTGARATANSTVEVRYVITLMDGSPFWSTYDVGLTEVHALPGVIRGWREGIPLIREGGMIRMIIPSGLGYGPNGLSDKIPGNANLLCTLELVKVVK